MEIKEMNIYEKIAKVIEEMEVVAKGLKVEINKTRSYNAVSERDILDAVKPLETKYRIYSYPVKRTITDRDVLIKESEYNGNITKTNTLFMRIDTIYRFVNIDKPEEYIETIVYGDGLDTGDKAPGKAMTYADKYALMKTYKISTGDDPDKEASPEKGYTTEEDDLKNKIKSYGQKASDILKEKGVKLSSLNKKELKELLETLQNDI